jgi:hypothetical protein
MGHTTVLVFNGVKPGTPFHHNSEYVVDMLNDAMEKCRFEQPDGTSLQFKFNKGVDGLTDSWSIQAKIDQKTIEDCIKEQLVPGGFQEGTFKWMVDGNFDETTEPSDLTFVMHYACIDL